ncbi:Pirin-like protein [Salinisphaera sp. PC39]|uniref:pirin family protein n=1 Tax=Salinisphaera sp. PC39 TaxID=1304156 RepID=UPI003342853E
MRERQIERRLHSHPSQDGDGVRISRIHDFGGGLDPFLMLDELGAERPEDIGGGFPPHPHRGIQTLTYVLRGGLTHSDHLGHSSSIGAGEAQWMHTGRGIVHSEMPLTGGDGLHAFQLWLNLAAADKLSAAAYRNVAAAEMPRIRVPAGELIALGGDWRLHGEQVTGPLDALAGDAAVAHLRLSGGAVTLDQAAPTLLVHVFAGRLQVGDQVLGRGELARLGSGTRLRLAADADSEALLLAGTPHGEPIAHYGPFVMNTREEIEQTLREYRDGVLTQEA